MKKPHFTIVRLLVLSALFVVGAFGNPVSLDTSFNGTGYHVRPLVPAPQGSYSNSFAIQPDGKIVMGGYVTNASDGKFALMRLNADGTLDTSFGSGGSVITLVGVTDQGNCVLLQPDGKILLSGFSWMDDTSYNFTLLRYTSSGALDTTFNGTGIVTLNHTGSSWDYGNDIVLQPDGKIVMVGSTTADLTTQADAVVMRFNTDGTLDTNFNGTGILTIADPTLSEGAGSVIILPDGKMLIGGFKKDSVKANFRLMRFNSVGSLDTSFGTGGSTMTSAGSGDNYLSAMALQSDGKIVASGSGYIARYSANGILDTSFGTAGVAKVPSLYETTGMKIAADDKVLVVSRGIYRFTPNGVLDTHFNDGGFIRMATPNVDCGGTSLAFKSDNTILLGGFCYPNNVPNFALFRYKETRSKRFMDFNGDGVTDIAIFRPSNGQWWYLDSYNLSYQSQIGPFGLATDTPVPADYTGDGRADVAVYRQSTGEWYVLRSEDSTYYAFPFGTTGDIPVAADYDGDDKADAAVFRPSTGIWYILKSTGGVTITPFGTAGDKPVPSDYDGDFKTDIAVYRPSSGQWWIQRSSDAAYNVLQFGTSTDIPVQGDYTGDGKTDAAFWRPSTQEWFVLRSEDSSYYAGPYGLAGDIPTPGNYSGDGRFDMAIFRPSTSTWHVQTTGGAYFHTVFGQAGDQPLQKDALP